MIKRFVDNNNRLMAIVIPSDYCSEGIEFFSEKEDYQQVALMSHSAGHIIVPHYHNNIPRTIDYTCETLVIRKGVLEVQLFDNKTILHSFTIKEGDVLTLLSGGHGFRVVEDIDMIEIKQGPYLGEADKTRF